MHGQLRRCRAGEASRGRHSGSEACVNINDGRHTEHAGPHHDENTDCRLCVTGVKMSSAAVMLGTESAIGEIPEKLSASEKKKLRRKKSKQSKKELKSSQVELHAALHKAQAAEGSAQRDRAGKAQREGDALLKASETQSVQHVIEYVPEPLTALEALSKAAEDAALEDNPYGGVTGLEITDTGGPKSDLADLQRIAQHFASQDDTAGAADNTVVADQPSVTTQVVEEKEEEKLVPEEGMIAAALWFNYHELICCPRDSPTQDRKSCLAHESISLSSEWAQKADSILFACHVWIRDVI